MNRLIYTILISTILLSCSNEKADNSSQESNAPEDNQMTSEIRHFRGALTGGMKGDSIFFDVNGNRLENLTFKGHWYCDGSLSSETAAGPEGYFIIKDNKVNDHISEPPDGGASSWRFDLEANLNGNKASGTFRMNINALNCNTGTLNWSAATD